MRRDRQLHDGRGEIISWPVSRVRSLRLSQEWALLAEQLKVNAGAVICCIAFLLGVVGCLCLTHQTDVLAGIVWPPGSNHVTATEIVNCGTALSHAPRPLPSGTIYAGLTCPQARWPYLVSGYTLCGVTAALAGTGLLVYLRARNALTPKPRRS